ncbi:hypothetical protein [Candidatus Protochlamydia amoebophila]|nr:hypothetical protein [Candidatus Protochlamydia amoebophila]
MSLNEINDSSKSLTHQKNEALKTKSSTKQNFVKSPISLNKPIPSIPKNLNKENFKNLDWKKTFNSDEKKFLNYLLHLKPVQGDCIEEKHATWWIKNFGIEKIKIALQVYWQQQSKFKNSYANEASSICQASFK